MHVGIGLPDKSAGLQNASLASRSVHEVAPPKQTRNLLVRRWWNVSGHRIELHFYRNRRGEWEPEKGQDSDCGYTHECSGAGETVCRQVAESLVDVVEAVLQARHEVFGGFGAGQLCEKITCSSDHPVIAGAAGAGGDMFTKFRLPVRRKNAIAVIGVFLYEAITIAVHVPFDCG